MMGKNTNNLCRRLPRTKGKKSKTIVTTTCSRETNSPSPHPNTSGCPAQAHDGKETPTTCAAAYHARKEKKQGKSKTVVTTTCSPVKQIPLHHIPTPAHVLPKPMHAYAKICK
jgi:hypothetical protein